MSEEYKLSVQHSVLLLLIYCLLLLLLFVGFLCLILFCYAVDVLSSSRLGGEERAGCFVFIVLLMSMVYGCSSLSRGLVCSV